MFPGKLFTCKCPRCGGEAISKAPETDQTVRFSHECKEDDWHVWSVEVKDLD